MLLHSFGNLEHMHDKLQDLLETLPTKKMHSSLVVFSPRLSLFVIATAIILVANVNGIRQNKLATANNDFAFSLYKAIERSNTGRNVFFSPVSISVGLGMVHAGAAGETKTQLASVMGLSEFTPDSVNTEFRDLLETLNAPGNNYTLWAVNRLFGQKGFGFRREFLQVTDDYYRAALEALDFRGQPEKSRMQINDWVAMKTADKIKDLLPDGAIDDSTVLVLVNAIYFKGLWSNPFDKSATKQRTFHLSLNKLASMEMMTMDVRDLEYFDSVPLRSAVLELPYVGGQASMFIFRPNDIEGLNWVESKLNAQTLDEVFNSLRTEKVTVTLPKFVLDQGVALKQFLQEIGIVNLFDGPKADLSGIDGTKNLVVTEAMHKAYVAVDEEGTEAAGSTGIVIKVKSAGPNTIEFVVDRPFLFLIADKTTGTVLFVGRLTQPPQQGDGNIGEFGRTGAQRYAGSSTTMRPTVASWLAAALLTAAFVDALRRL